MELLNTLHELCDTISLELHECTEKIRQANGKITAGDVDYLDKLTHTMKSLKTTIAMIEAEDKGYSRGGRYYYDGEDGGSYESNRGSYEGGGSYGSYGRGRYANRDRIGRYTERYSRADANEDFKRELEEAMAKAPDEQSRKRIEKLMNEMN
jgi:hypothetical protein